MIGLLSWLLILAFHVAQSANIPTDYDRYGSRLASNDEVVVLARNDLLHFVLIFAPFGPENYCAYRYPPSFDLVLNIAIGQPQNGDCTRLVYLNYHDDGSSSHLELGSHYVNKTACLAGTADASGFSHHEFEEALEYFSILKVDSMGDYTYQFFNSYVYIFDINEENITIIEWEKLLPDVTAFYPKDADITITNDNVRIAILVGYFEVNIDSTLPTVYLFRLEPPSNMFLLDNLTLINDTVVGGTFAFHYDFDYVMSVSIEHHTQQVLISLPSYEKTFLLAFTSTNIILLKTYSQPARSVTWIDNGTRAALLLSEVPTLPWAYSQIQVIDTTLENTAHATIYAIPNSQQAITFNSPNHLYYFIRITTSNGQPVILTDAGLIIYALSTPAGYFVQLTEISSYANTPQSCPAGTYKNYIGPGPCIVCPTGYKNPMISVPLSFKKNITSFTNIECIPCLSNSFCPLASVNEVNLSRFSSIDQAYAYPNSPASTSYDDIILTNTFQINSKDRHCLVVSPMFWTSLVLGICGIVLVLMSILYWMPTSRGRFKYLTHVFRHFDLIGQGEYWIGGLLSFAILVLLTFVFWFGSVYIKEYPIETAGDSNFACDTSLRNAKFTSNLQMLAVKRLKEEEFIFDLLDQQNWTLTVDFIQTGFKCEDILIENDIESYQIKVPMKKCFLQADNATRTVILPISNHLLSIQFNLTGNSYIGGIRICLNGSMKSDDENHSTVKELSFCKLISSRDQTISQRTEIILDLTKVINRTEGLASNDPTIYSGIWIPTMTIKSLNDHLAYEQQGSYIRYLSFQQIVVIDLSETQFFIKNTEQPIARLDEIIFHNILFFNVCIELFGLVFLIFKLAILPLTRKLIEKIEHRHREKNKLQSTFL